MEFNEIEVGASNDMPSKVVLYGVPKIGKSRLAAEFPDPFFIDVEGGLNYLGRKVRATPKLKTFDEVLGWLNHILNDESFTAGTIIIDSLDWVEKLSQERLIKREGATSITDPSCKAFAYYKGVETAASDAMRVLTACDMIYEKKGIKCLMIAHSEIKSVDLPNQDPYSRHQLKLSKYLGSRVNEWADLILFADYTFHVTQEGKTSEPKPMLLAGGSASFVGGGRMKLSKQIPLNYQSLEKEITNE